MRKGYDLCTVVDVGYLARALVLHRALVEHAGVARLRVLCMDERTEELLARLAPPGIETIPVRELEDADPALLAARPGRTLAEYCWTLKPSLLRYLLERDPGLEHLAYVDADHMFWHEPGAVWSELGSGTALIVPQRTRSERAGRYNAGFVLVRRGPETERLLAWWRERCLEWSFEGVGGGIRRFGDQGYLTEWPERFSGIRVLEHPGGGLAPWNSGFHALAAGAATVMVDGVPLLFYHHQSLRPYLGLRTFHRFGLLGDRYRLHASPVPFVWTISRWYPFSEDERTLVWEPYVQRLSEAFAELRTVERGFDAGLQRLAYAEIVREALRTTRRRLARGALGRRAQARPSRGADG